MPLTLSLSPANAGARGPLTTAGARGLLERMV
jgi:hypothetical protein